MSLPTKVAAHVAVLGAALVAASLWPVHTAARASMSDATSVTAPAAAAAGTVARRPTGPAERPSRRPARRQRTTRPVAGRAAGGAAARGVTRRHAHRAARRRRQAIAPATGWPALDVAVSRIPSYQAGSARWVVSSRYGHWGATDWYHGVIYVSPSVPTSYLYAVAAHEWSHELSVLDYGGNVEAAVRAMDRFFGGSGLVGAERAADCMAIVQGATWTYYTSCESHRWRAGAARLVHGGRL